MIFALALITVLITGGVALKLRMVEASGLAAYPPAGEVIELDGTRVHILQEGAGPDLLILHGAGGNTREFTFSMMAKLTNRYRVTLIDRPGHGHTKRIETRAGEGESLSEQADLIVAALASKGITQTLVAGQSYGGAVALNIATRYPDLVQGLTLISAASNVWEGELDRWYRLNDTWWGQNIVTPLLAAFATDARARNTVSGIFAPDPVPEGYLDHIGVPLSLRPVQLRATAQQVNRLRDDLAAQVPGYAEITVPVQIIHGTQDATVPLETHARPLSRQITHATLTELEGRGHMPHHSAETQVIAAIDRMAASALRN